MQHFKINFAEHALTLDHRPAGDSDALELLKNMFAAADDLEFSLTNFCVADFYLSAKHPSELT